MLQAYAICAYKNCVSAGVTKGCFMLRDETCFLSKMSVVKKQLVNRHFG